MNPQYPVYVISKGRWESRLTVKALQWMKVPFHVVIEPQEFREYSAVIPKENIYQLPFSNRGEGSIPARNWCWEHSLSIGADRHWILDDNITGFVKLTDNSKIQVATGTFFRIMEDFIARYDNVALAGPHYDFFAKRKQKLPPIYLNRRVYSCILIDNSLPYRWRGRYNEDTDLTLRALKEGRSTMLFLHHLACKSATMTMKGGNTDELYKKAENIEEDGRWKMAKSLCEQHPDVSAIHWKFGRWQHHVNYEPYKYNDPRPKSWVEKIPFGSRTERMDLVQIGEPA